MTDIETALVEWREYDDAHDGVVVRDCQQDGWWNGQFWGAARAEDHCIGWAHRELERLGWSVSTWQCNPKHENNGWLTATLGLKYPAHMTRPQPGVQAFFRSATLLGCFLKAIKATEKK